MFDVLFFFHKLSQKAHKCHFFVALVKGIKGDVGEELLLVQTGSRLDIKTVYWE